MSEISETQSKLDELMNEYEVAVIGENRGRNRSGYSEKADKYYQKRRELKEFVGKIEGEYRWIPVSERLPEIEEGDSKEYDVVITYPRESSVTVASWTYNIFDKTHQRRIWTEDQGEFGHEDITKYVTHWRERPKPPEVK